MKKIIWLLLTTVSLFGATATPVNISAISRAANVVTVTCSAACNIVPNQGFIVAGVTDVTFNGNGTAVTGSGTGFTFNQIGTNVSSSAGTVLPAKQVIVLTTKPGQDGLTVTGVFWITTVSGIAATAQSSWTGASTAEKNAIAAGTTIEVPFTQLFGSTASKATIQGELQSLYVGRQASQNSASVQPAAFFGGFFDGVGWSF